MLDEELANKYHLQKQLQGNLSHPYFSEKSPLWAKNGTSSDCGCPTSSKRYLFTKVGKFMGFETTRYLSLCGRRLYYFDSADSEVCLGSCQIENIYLRWLKVDQKKYLLLLSNGFESTSYFFNSDKFLVDNRAQLTKYVVQMDFYNHFQILEELGQGAFSTVFKVRHKRSGQQLSAKSLALDTPKHIILRELSVLRQLMGAQHVSQYWGLFQSNEQLILLTQFAEGRDLMTFINYSHSITIEEIRIILNGIARGLKEIHKRKIVHRDIKPQNIVINLDTSEPTIIDYGMALDLKRQCQFKKCGTLAYMAPEVYNCESKSRPYNTKSDWFSLGVIAHILMVGQNPLRGKEGDSVPFNREEHVKWNEAKIRAKYGDCGVQLVSGLMNQNSCRRWCGDKLLGSHFLNGDYDWKRSDSYSTVEDRHFVGSY